MKSFIAIILSYLLISAPALGHGGSHAPVPPEVAIKIASSVAKQFTEIDPGLGFGILAANWANLPKEQVSIFKKGKGYYIVEVSNSVEKKSLFVLMAVSGEVYDANFSGEFKGLKQ